MAFAITVQATAAPAHVDTVKQALTTLARESVDQPGTLRYEFHQSYDDPATFLLVAVWESEDGWQANVTSEAHDRYLAALPEDAWAVPPELSKWRPFADPA